MCFQILCALHWWTKKSHSVPRFCLSTLGCPREVLGLLPASLRPAAQRLAATVTTVVLDVGRPPQVFCGAEAVDLAEDEAAVVTPEDVAQLPVWDFFGRRGPRNLAGSG